MKTDKIALGMLGGIAAGAILGILFAPEKGTVTRKKIQQKSNDFSDILKDKFENMSEILKNNCDEILNNGKNLIAEGKSKFDDAKNEFKNVNA